jgi:hypothetical protein
MDESVKQINEIIEKVKSNSVYEGNDFTCGNFNRTV